ncbi:MULTISPECIES: glucose PTS transporter transcription antiterminator GlcT [Bacillaceae]|uniref:Transcriptional antiterminator n=1 Tax=Alkalicoccobacillus plakortidis TaxID=444060 RepID=A0A9D5DNB3_9BACI|nr:MULTISPECIES: transcription antiterminator [Bacillaceae]KQL56901.1 transcriptional antiterminator [Alkalicoccobacillus plakortidis]
MEAYRVKKVLNNNVLIAIIDEEEVILIGKGIGFNRKKDSTVPSTEAEKVFVLKNEKEQRSYLTLLPNVEKSLLDVTIEAIELISKRLGAPLNEHIHVGLMDHLSFAQSRTAAGLHISNPFLTETKLLYPNEYAIAVEVLHLIEERLHMKMQPEEAGFIALHIHSAVKNKDLGTVNAHSQLVSKLLGIIEEQLDIVLDKESIDYMRLVRHLRFTIERVENNEEVEEAKAIDTLLKQEYPLCYNLSWKLIKIMQHSLGKPVFDAEAVYLTMHLQRVQHKYK